MSRDLLSEEGLKGYAELNGIIVPKGTNDQPPICDEMAMIFAALAEAADKSTDLRPGIDYNPALA